MKRVLTRTLRHPRLVGVKRGLLALRGLVFRGRRYRCPCCASSLRGFVGRGGWWATRADGYCPRCNAKARHRRIWLFLQEHTDLFSSETRLLEVAPWWSFAEAFRRLPNIRFVGLDLTRTGPQVNVCGDATEMPLVSGSFDALLCIHVLEHIDDDRGAIAEMFRVLRPGGWAVVSVPLRLDQPTHEDPSITDPVERARVFGERGHLRLYGVDLEERLAAAGFEVRLDRAADLAAETRRSFGLRDDENVFYCRKPVSGA